jgi:hypothetical protein
MSPAKKQAAVQQGASSRGLIQSSMLQFMPSVKAINESPDASFTTQTPEKSNQHFYKNNRLNQQSIIQYLTPPNKPPHTTPIRPAKTAVQNIRLLPVKRDLYRISLLLEPLTSTDNPDPIFLPASSSIPHSLTWQQSTLHAYFTIAPLNIPSVAQIPSQSILMDQRTSPSPLARTARKALLRYNNNPRRSPNRITRYTVSLPTYDLFDSWGHFLEPIEVNTTLRVFLQNPNGLSIHRNNHLLNHDFQTCHQ